MTRKRSMFFEEKRILSKYPYWFIVLGVLSIKIVSIFPAFTAFKLERLIHSGRLVRGIVRRTKH